MCECLGSIEPIVSPTFTIINEYNRARLPLYHLDLYRLETAEIVGLNLDTYWEGVEVEPGIVAIEWAQRLPYKPDAYLTINLANDNKSQDLEEVNSAGRTAQIIPFNFSLDEKILALSEEPNC